MKKRLLEEVLKDLIMLGIGVFLTMFFLSSCEVKKPQEAPMPPKLVQPVIPPQVVKPAPTPVQRVAPQVNRSFFVTQALRTSNGCGWVVKVNPATLKNKNLKVRMQVGYVQYDGQLVGNEYKFNPDWTPQGNVYMGIWDTQTSKYVSSVRVA